MLEKSLTCALAALLALGCGGDGGSWSNVPSFPNGSSGAGGDALGGGGLATVGASGNSGSGGAVPGGMASGGAESGGPNSLGSQSGTSGVGVGGAGVGGAGTGEPGPLEWLPSWATTIQSTETNNLPPPLPNNTLRQFVWPTVSGQEIRIQLSNQRGSSPVDIQKVHIARALTQGNPGNSNGQIDTATDVAFTFNGMPSVTIAAGEAVWSDALAFPLQEITLTAVTMQFGTAVPPEITGHPGARMNSYIANGDLVSQQGLAGAQTRERWYFINAIEVMAPANAYAIAALGDSITDGFNVHDQFARWPDFLTLALQNDPLLSDSRSVLNFGMGANNLTVSGAFQDSGVVRFGRDVLTRDKIKWLIVFQGINDIIYSNVQAPQIISAYQQIIAAAHEKGILVYGATITPTNQGDAGIRGQVNEWIKTSGEFDTVLDFEAVLRDPANPNGILGMLNNDGLHPNLAGYEALGNAVDLSLFYESMGN